MVGIADGIIFGVSRNKVAFRFRGVLAAAVMVRAAREGRMVALYRAVRAA